SGPSDSDRWHSLGFNLAGNALGFVRGPLNLAPRDWARAVARRHGLCCRRLLRSIHGFKPTIRRETFRLAKEPIDLAPLKRIAAPAERRALKQIPAVADRRAELLGHSAQRHGDNQHRKGKGSVSPHGTP